MNAEERLLAFIREHVAAKGYGPTLREMAAAMGWASTNGVRFWLTKLVERGAVEVDHRVARGVRVTAKEG